ncbi:gastrokine-1-like [Cuculus canorus]|uniref:gastrokine-1-like n=1 Tax=Cuculus canorus TaxID=55661 RepID=UPI0023AAE91F|nr:gastrokine-1-like [Cuculus canorus]
MDSYLRIIRDCQVQNPPTDEAVTVKINFQRHADRDTNHKIILFQHWTVPPLNLNTYIRWTVHIAHSACTSISSAVKMKFTIVTTVLLGLLLTPALADYNLDTEGNQHSNGNHQNINEVFQKTPIMRKQVSVAGGLQTLTLHRQRRIATIHQEGSQGSWKTMWNYNSGAVATKVLPQRACYVSKVDRKQLPHFDELSAVADESMSQKGQTQPSKKLTFVTERRIRDPRSYGQDIVDLCRGLPTYNAYVVLGEYRHMESIYD